MKLLVTGAWNCTRQQLNKIRELGYDVVFMQNEKDQLPCMADEIDGVICNGLFLYHDIEKFISLKFIQLTSAGFDRVPMDYVNSHGISIYNARGVYSVPMAEFAICGVLQLYKQSKFFYRNQEKHEWNKHRGLLELYGKTVCIVGCGSVGTECAKRFSAFGCKVVGVDLYPRADENYQNMYELTMLDGELTKSDVVVLTVPLTDETRNLINGTRLKLMKNGSVLVNIARGAVVDEKALLDALDDNLYGAVIDVFEKEPLSDNSELWNKENVILTPHNSFVGEGNDDRLYKIILENIGEIK